MPYPWANILLMLLLAIELATGLFGLVSGASDRAIFLHIHRIGGFAILVVFIWKSRNIFTSIARRFGGGRSQPQTTRATAIPMGSLALMVLLSGTIVLALAWSHLGSYSFMRISGVSWHIYLSLAMAPLLAYHAIAHRWTFRPRLWAERRMFLRVGGLAVAGVAIWQFSETASAWLKLPGAERRFTGSYEARSFSGNAFPSTSWINDDPAAIDVDKWRLRIDGHVKRALAISYEELAAMPTREITATLDCTGGWYSEQVWEGVPLRGLLDRAGIADDAASVTVWSVTGYNRRFSIEESEELLLALSVGGEQISHRHGFPVRLAAPGRRGYEWVKWVTRLEVNDTGKWLQWPLPVQ